MAIDIFRQSDILTKESNPKIQKESVEQLMYCPKCGKECPDNAKFCDGCGADLTASNPSAQPNFNPNPNPNTQSFAAPIKNRSIAVCIILSIITCGIYGLYWLACVVKDLNTASNHPEDMSGGLVVLLSIVTASIYLWFWLYKAGEKVAYIKRQSTGISDNNSAILYLVLGILGFSVISIALIQSELNKIATV